jgi:50S ribosomal protein L16 3-hydroxylase
VSSLTPLAGLVHPAPGALSPVYDATASFWSDFAARYYARESFEASDAPVGIEISPDEMFRLLLRSCAARGNGRKDPQVKFYVAQRQVRLDIDDYLPRLTDGSLDGYLARMDDELRGQPYMLTVQRMQAASRRLWTKAAEFVAGLYDATGVLPGDAEVEAFVGRYPHTNSGIHQERSGVFVTMVHGVKDMLVWPPETVGLPLESSRYDQARASARVLRCEPGKLVYWPPLHWHVGECPGGSTAGLHVAVLQGPPPLQEVLSSTTGGIPSAASLDWRAPEAHVLGFPRQYQEVARTLVAAYGDTTAVRDRLVADWLRRRTGFGFSAPPPRLAAHALKENHIVARDSLHPIVLARRDKATSWCAADGRVAWMRSAPALTRTIDMLNSGENVAIHAALGFAAEPIERELLKQALVLLTGWRALKVIA